jgi:nicotinamidase-related amidase
VAGRSTANAFTHPPTANDIVGLGRKTLLLAGVLTEVMIQHTGLSGAERGYYVQVVVDACGALSPRTEDAALRRLVQAGVTITSSASIAAQLMDDLTQSPKAAEALKLLFEISMAA